MQKSMLSSRFLVTTLYNCPFAYPPPQCRFSSSTSENGSKRLRELYLDFFASHAHTRIPSAPVLAKHSRYNQSDFICSGIQQFVPVIVGEQPAPAKRVVNSQKCIRLMDKDLVGVDNQHHTFFEMLGNWSFGDYHKEEACNFAWQFLTDILRIDSSRLYITYFGGDEEFEADNETRDIWRRMGIPDSHILPFGADCNFWKIGPTGPCGSCTEIHVDKRWPNRRDAGHLVNTDDPTMLELWNIVFMQHFRHDDGSVTQLPLQKIVDTGMGFERLCALMQNCDSAYETDLFRDVIRRIEELSSHKARYQGQLIPNDLDERDTAFRIVADHIRTIVVTLAEDFKITSHKKFARKIKDLFKKTALTAHEKLGLPRGALAELVPLVVDQLGDAHPNLRQNERMVVEKVRTEEDRLWAQRDKGRKRMSQMMTQILKQQPREGTKFPGKFAFELVYDYRLELDLVQQFVAQQGLQIDDEEYQNLMARIIYNTPLKPLQIDNKL